VQTSLRFVEGPPRRVYIKDELRNGWGDQFGRPRNAVVGSDSYVRTALAKPGWELVKMKVRLPGGTLRLRARGPVVGATIVLRVVGGTGRYARARGTNTLRLRDLVNLNDYELRLPSS
jgi:hypothetical protein